MVISKPPLATILVVGDVLLDTHLWGRCERISPEAPVPVVDVDRQTHGLGGAGNVVANLRALGAGVELVTVVGDDEPASTVRRLLEEETVGLEGAITAPGRRTPEKTRVSATNQHVLRYDQETTAPIPGDLEGQALQRAEQVMDGVGAVILSDYGKGVLGGGLCQGVIRLARQQGKPVLCDPKGRDFSPYAGAFVITPNRKEASLAAGIPIEDQTSLERAGRQLLDACDLEWLLITLGREGMALLGCGQDGVQRIRAGARDVFDVSGAGDTVVAALGFGLAKGMEMLDACHFANVAAGIVVGKFGAARATLEEIEGQLQPSLTRQSARKVVGLDRLCHVVQREQRAGRRVVFTNGCFDLIHAGHVKFLEDAAALGDVLIVGLNSDASIRRLKGAQRPIQDSQDRAALVAALQSVDYVIFFDQDTPLELIRGLCPDVLVKGQDYTVETVVGAEEVQARGGEVLLLPIMKDRSTSATIRRIVDAFSGQDTE